MEIQGIKNKFDTGDSSIDALPHCRIEALVTFLKAKNSLRVSCFLAKVDVAWLKENATDEQLELIASHHHIPKIALDDEDEPFETAVFDQTEILE